MNENDIDDIIEDGHVDELDISTGGMSRSQYPVRTLGLPNNTSCLRSILWRMTV